MSTSKLPNFANLNGELVTPQPYYERGAKFYNFLFKSNNPAALQKVVDTWFNEPSGGQVHYKPLIPYVIVSFCNYRGGSSYDKPWIDQGFAPYNELVFTIPVAEVKQEWGVWLVENIWAFVPYIFVDNAMAMAAGREVYGMPKTMGEFYIPPSYKYPYTFTCDTVTLPKYSPTTVAVNQRVAEIRQVPGTHDESLAEEVWEDSSIAYDAVKELIFGHNETIIPGIELMKEIAQVFLKGEAPFVSLQQIRNIEDGSKASYQAIIEFTAKLKEFSGAGLMQGEFELRLPHSDMFPIAADLGLDPKGQQSCASWWLNWDFLFEGGKEIWTPST